MTTAAHSAPCVHVATERLHGGAPVNRLIAVFALTAGFMVVEAIGGWISGSLALLADAGHMLTDVAALGLTLFTAWLARRPASQSKTYGNLRWEILAALINGATLFGLAGWVVIEAIGRIGDPQPIQGTLFFGIALTGLIVNLISIGILHGAHQHHLNTRGAYLHILGDLLGSVGAVAAALIVIFTGWTLADPIISVALSLLILFGAWRLVRESTDVLLEAAPAHISMNEVATRMRAVAGVTAVHDLHVWTVASGMVAMSGHAMVPDLDRHPGVLAGIRDALADLGIQHVTIQLESRDECGGEPEKVAAARDSPGGCGHKH